MICRLHATYFCAITTAGKRDYTIFSRRNIATTFSLRGSNISHFDAFK